MRRTTLALAATSTGIALLVGVRAQSAGASAARGRPAATRAVPAAVTGRYTGSAIVTRYGTVQVEAVLTAGRLSDVVVLQQTHGGKSEQVDARALPLLRAEALAAQGAAIDAVSGASYTSLGYTRSLQAALDRAHGH